MVPLCAVLGDGLAAGVAAYRPDCTTTPRVCWILPAGLWKRTGQWPHPESRRPCWYHVL